MLTVNLDVEDESSFVSGVLPSSVPIEANKSSATIELPTVDDAVDELNGTVKVTIQSGANYQVGSSNSASVEVEDNDVPAITISANRASAVEGAALVFTLTASPVPAVALSVNIEADGGGSFRSVSAPPPVNLAAGASTATLSLPTTDDAMDEPDATVTVTIKKGTNYQPGSSKSATTKVEDNDPPAISIARAAGQADKVQEGATLQFTLSATSAPTKASGLDVTG